MLTEEDPLCVRCKQLTLNIKMAVYWDVAPCNLAEIYRSFRRAYCAIIRAMLGIGKARNFLEFDSLKIVFVKPITLEVRNSNFYIFSSFLKKYFAELPYKINFHFKL
jgi:hypothetical protein